MWLSQRRQTELEETAAELGQVTVPGAPAGVALAGERRDVALCLPGGYHWTPKRGDTVLVVKGGASWEHRRGRRSRRGRYFFR